MLRFVVSLVVFMVLISAASADCVWRGTAPACSGSCKANEYEMERGKGQSFGAGDVPDSGALCITGTKALCCKACPAGLVFRKPSSNDYTCVTPAEREAAINGFETAPAPKKPVRVIERTGKSRTTDAPAPRDETGRRIVRTDTDVYNAREGEKIGTLRAGQSVKTAGACGNDWCQLSNGTWFWGGDLE